MAIVINVNSNNKSIWLWDKSIFSSMQMEMPEIWKPALGDLEELLFSIFLETDTELYSLAHSDKIAIP